MIDAREYRRFAATRLARERAAKRAASNAAANTATSSGRSSGSGSAGTASGAQRRAGVVAQGQQRGPRPSMVPAATWHGLSVPRLLGWIGSTVSRTAPMQSLFPAKPRVWTDPKWRPAPLTAKPAYWLPIPVRPGTGVYHTDQGRDDDRRRGFWGTVGRGISKGVGAGWSATKWTGGAAWDIGGAGLKLTTGTDQVPKLPGALWAQTKYTLTPKLVLPVPAVLEGLRLYHNLGDPLHIRPVAKRVSEAGVVGALLEQSGVRIPRRWERAARRFSRLPKYLDVASFFAGQFDATATAHDLATGKGSFEEYATSNAASALAIGSLLVPEVRAAALGLDAFLLARDIDKAVFGTRARGGRVRRGEMTLVGERGPEIVQLPAGSNVIPAHRSRMALEQPGAGALPSRASRELHLHQILDGREIARSTIRNLDDDEQWGRA